MKKVECIKNLIAIVFVLIAAILIIPMLFGIKPFIVMSGSMSPTVRVGSLAYIDTYTDPEKIEVGDIVAYRMDGMVVTHRVVDIEGKNITTKGDANDAIDLSPRTQNQIIGKLRYSIPYMGYVAYFIQSPIRILKKKSIGGNADE